MTRRASLVGRRRSGAECPRIGASDYGPDAVCVGWSLGYHFSISCRRLFDFAHGGHSELHSCAHLRALGLYIALQGVRQPHCAAHVGGARVIHIICAMTQAYRHACRTAPILALLALVIFEQLTVAGLRRARDLPLEQDAWHRCSTWAPFARVGSQLRLSRCHCIKLHCAS